MFGPHPKSYRVKCPRPRLYHRRAAPPRSAASRIAPQPAHRGSGSPLWLPPCSRMPVSSPIAWRSSLPCNTSEEQPGAAHRLSVRAAGDGSRPLNRPTVRVRSAMPSSTQSATIGAGDADIIVAGGAEAISTRAVVHRKAKSLYQLPHFMTLEPRAAWSRRRLSPPCRRREPSRKRSAS